MVETAGVRAKKGKYLWLYIYMHILYVYILAYVCMHNYIE